MNSLTDLSPGPDAPAEVNALIEISKGEGRVKYEFDRHSGVIVVDRLRDSSMHYPVNYGCIPRTLSDDGDPLDVLVYCTEPIQTGAVIAVRPIGVLIMSDEEGGDEKIIAVPADHVSDAYLHIRTIADLPPGELRKIKHFFEHYKDLEGKTVNAGNWEDVAAAHDCIRRAIDAAKAEAAQKHVPPQPPVP